MDGELTHDIVDRLETEFDVLVRIVGVDVEYGDDWTVFVDGEPVGSVARQRSRNRYTVFEVSSDGFASRRDGPVSRRRGDRSCTRPVRANRGAHAHGKYSHERFG